MKYLFEDKTEKIIKCFYKVYNTLGYGFLEKVYENALYNELIAGQWWMTKSHIWGTRKKSEVVEERVRKQDTDYVSPYDLVPDANGYISIDVDVTFEKDCYYRILVVVVN